MKGVLIVLFGPAEIGKTSTIIRVAQTFGMNQPYGSDFCKVCPHPVFDLNIGFASMGDPDSAQEDSIKELINNNCKIVVCASRTRGETVNNITRLAQIYDYQIIWGTPFYEINLVINPKVMHDASADAVVSLINRIATIL